ncbi:PREDICTED: carbohydrate sulfotransferase 11-like [Polistes dominula]|uniref:Carbohydrate sulfotransferase n=1 Tax=Polistes dominula TaxID=743375 RepID=A0ABM1IRG0_POLDO|nr:PREDICTED: carbohydrate sulfotransferase 11-like [Polistes dominula]XP_015182789.1 PREDICTED: carbohydrate sulfotransferase 11-like [Polistes dominula]XP_015182797.1 PREDICTED: carbohydrate sulfotransferase 11-like [Polistes dominula]XP_015182806.1 PREDICTED: carbohydrate sulfotransferase 11-like [Polistes dominula]XP_015182814.1 PREDICTED: carbohydrate sulfotransferase 11-like [Polistes dominula]XP_015182824.1 PREDICTED: carbohydrate sulfotransferase 11-like [Polistes dominula]XP_01518283
MTGCRVFKEIILNLVIWNSILSAEKIDEEVLLEYGNPKYLESQKYMYSWTGPNALARSALLERQERLQYNCEEFLRRNNVESGTLTSESFRNILVDEQHELLYCYVPKVACTNWKRVLMVATGKWPGNDPLEIPADQAHSPGVFLRLSNYTLSEIEQKLLAYDKLIVVRHPFERLLSAYRNKLEAKNEKSSRYFQTRFGKKIIKKYRVNATQESLKNGDDVTFREFVEFIINDSENGTKNEHWRPIYELCHPCIVNYNLVSKYETLVEDATEVLERMNVVSVNFPSKPSSSEPTSKKLDRYYSTLSYKQLRKLEDLYKLDLKLFDYSLEDVLGFSLA